jgi:hypothetical protein
MMRCTRQEALMGRRETLTEREHFTLLAMGWMQLVEVGYDPVINR